jgi:RNA polymerase sigma factor (TIGR02999 family)
MASDLTPPKHTLTRLLQSYKAGESDTAGQLVNLFYPELRRLAASRMRFEDPDHTWQPTALLHELYLELRKVRGLRTVTVNSGQDRAAFFGLAARLMKRLLIHHARPLAKRHEKIQLGGRLDSPDVGSPTVDDIELLLSRLSGLDPKLRAVVEMKVFEGLTEGEIASRLRCHVRTVERYWKFARQWLRTEFARPAGRMSQYERPNSV